MGNNIKVDHSKFESTANAIDDYNRKMKSKMKSADTAVNVMMSNWYGVDAVAFKSKWNSVNNADSTYMMLYKSLESYANFLRDAAEKYKSAQIDAVNRANRLRRW